MRRLLASAMACLGALALTGSAYADTVYTLVNGTLIQFGGSFPVVYESLTGTITFAPDFTPTAANLTFSSMNGSLTSRGFTVAKTGGIVPAGPGSAYPGSSFFAVGITNPGEPEALVSLFVDLPATAGSPLVICGIGNICQEQPFEANSYVILPTADPLHGAYEFVDTPLLVPQVTPEPSSLVLLGTGVFGVLGMARRRLLGR